MKTRCIAAGVFVIAFAAGIFVQERKIRYLKKQIAEEAIKKEEALRRIANLKEEIEKAQAERNQLWAEVKKNGRNPE